MNTILVDQDIEGQVLLLWGVLAVEGWLELCSLQLVTFSQAGLPVDSSDRTVWRFAQTHGMMLLTHNRNMNDEDSLEQTIREENTPISLPVITILGGWSVSEKDLIASAALSAWSKLARR